MLSFDIKLRLCRLLESSIKAIHQGSIKDHTSDRLASNEHIDDRKVYELVYSIYEKQRE